jgi:hypothetical protein
MNRKQQSVQAYIINRLKKMGVEAVPGEPHLKRPFASVILSDTKEKDQKEFGYRYN